MQSDSYNMLRKLSSPGEYFLPILKYQLLIQVSRRRTCSQRLSSGGPRYAPLHRLIARTISATEKASSGFST